MPESYSLIMYEVIGGEGAQIALVDDALIDSHKYLREDLNFVNGHFANNTENKKAANIIAWRVWFASEREKIEDYSDMPEHKAEQFRLFSPYVLDLREGKPFNWKDYSAEDYQRISHIYHFGFVM